MCFCTTKRSLETPHRCSEDSPITKSTLRRGSWSKTERWSYDMRIVADYTIDQKSTIASQHTHHHPREPQRKSFKLKGSRPRARAPQDTASSTTVGNAMTTLYCMHRTDKVLINPSKDAMDAIWQAVQEDIQVLDRANETSSAPISKLLCRDQGPTPQASYGTSSSASHQHDPLGWFAALAVKCLPPPSCESPIGDQPEFSTSPSPLSLVSGAVFPTGDMVPKLFIPIRARLIIKSPPHPLPRVPLKTKANGGQSGREHVFAGRKTDNTETSPGSCLAKRVRKNHESRATIVLEDWLFRNFDNPYPSREQKRHLALMSMLREDQVVNWFNNARKRLCKSVASGHILLRDALK